MQRVVVLGSGGSGKSTLAARLGERTGLPVVHLDPIFWRPGWVAAPIDVALRALDGAAADDRWIIDGNFLDADGGATGQRLSRADTLIFLDLPRRTCRSSRGLPRGVRRRPAALDLALSAGGSAEGDAAHRAGPIARRRARAAIVGRGPAIPRRALKVAVVGCCQRT